MKTIPWIDDIAQLVGKVGSPAFNETFYSLFERVLGVEQCTVFAFPPSGPPIAVLVEANSSELRNYARQLAGVYVGGEFENDPSLSRLQSEIPTSVHSLRAEDVKDLRYRRCFYDEPRITHKLVLQGVMADNLYYLSFYRTTAQKQFNARNVEELNAFAEFALQIVNRHFELVYGAPTVPSLSDNASGVRLSRGKRERLLKHLKEVLLAQPHMLSPREAEICAGIILGYTTLGLSLNLGISINTVATHRKRAYQKLGVSRQNELFSRYYELVNRLH